MVIIIVNLFGTVYLVIKFRETKTSIDKMDEKFKKQISEVKNSDLAMFEMLEN